MKKFFAFLRGWVAYQCKRIQINAPLRMSIGRFGIWLVKVGRVLQVRYANWNSEFRLKVKLYPTVPDECDIYTSAVMTQEAIITFASPGSQLERQTSMVKELFRVKGGKFISSPMSLPSGRVAFLTGASFCRTLRRLF